MNEEELFAQLKKQQDEITRQFEKFFVGQGIVSQADYNKSIKKKDSK